jgi:hypothetical protein
MIEKQINENMLQESLLTYEYMVILTFVCLHISTYKNRYIDV